MLEARRLFASPTFGWTLDKPAANPVVHVDATGTDLADPSTFNAENLNLPAGSFNTAKGVDAAGRATFGPAAGAPADGNYEFTLPGSAFSPGGPDVSATDFFVNADFNHDRVVDFGDLVIFSQNSQGTGKSFSQGDADGDGDVDTDDQALLNARYNTRLAPAPTYEGEVTASSLAVQPDGSTPLVVNWETISDATVQASDPSNANKTVAGYTVYRSTDSTTFEPLADVMRITTDEPSVYGYTDSTPVDGTKYWYRIRPFYEVTQPDGSSGFQHLPTTNKAWRISALQGPSSVDATLGTDQLFISWRDNSQAESGFLLEQQDNYGIWNTLGQIPANVTSFAIDASFVGANADISNAVRVRAIAAGQGIDSVSIETLPTNLGSNVNVDPVFSRRINTLAEDDTEITYDLGIAHAFETVVVSDADGPGTSTLLAGTYHADLHGIVHILVLPNVRSLVPIKSTILIGGLDEGVIVTDFGLDLNNVQIEQLVTRVLDELEEIADVGDGVSPEEADLLKQAQAAIVSGRVGDALFELGLEIFTSVGSGLGKLIGAELATKVLDLATNDNLTGEAKDAALDALQADIRARYDIIAVEGEYEANGTVDKTRLVVVVDKTTGEMNAELSGVIDAVRNPDGSLTGGTHVNVQASGEVSIENQITILERTRIDNMRILD